MAQLMMVTNSCEFPVPAILKPEVLFTGKQALSLVLPCVTYKGPESVVIWNGQLLDGILTSKHLGPSSNGVIQCVCKVISSARALQFMNEMQLLCNTWLETQGLSVGLSDCLCDEKTLAKINKAMNARLEHANQVEARGKLIGVPFAQREQKVSRILGQMLPIAGSYVQQGMRPSNVLGLMIASGAKGNPINLSQISATVAQQSVEGQRMFNQHCPSERSIAYFPPGADDAASRGFVRHSYVQGLTFEEMFFHISCISFVALCAMIVRINVLFFILLTQTTDNKSLPKAVANLEAECTLRNDLPRKNSCLDQQDKCNKRGMRWEHKKQAMETLWKQIRKCFAPQLGCRFHISHGTKLVQCLLHGTVRPQHKQPRLRTVSHAYKFFRLLCSIVDPSRKKNNKINEKIFCHFAVQKKRCSAH